MVKRWHLSWAILFLIGIGSVTRAIAEETYIFTRFVFPGSGFTAALGVNAKGQIVGEYDRDSGGFLLDGGLFTKIPNVAGASATVPTALNEREDIVGITLAPDGNYRGFLLSGGQFTVIEFPESTVTLVYGINNKAQIVGQTIAGGVNGGFLLSDGTYSALNVPGAGEWTSPHGINNAGEIVG